MGPVGSLVAFACAPGKRAGEKPGQRNGIYAKHLLAHLETPGLRVEVHFFAIL